MNTERGKKIPQLIEVPMNGGITVEGGIYLNSDRMTAGRLILTRGSVMCALLLSLISLQAYQPQIINRDFAIRTAIFHKAGRDHIVLQLTLLTFAA